MFEYRLERRTVTPTAEQLNEWAGSGGWRLVSIVKEERGQSSANTMYAIYLERPSSAERGSA